MKKGIAILFMALATPAAGQARTNCYELYPDNEKLEEICYRQNRLEERIEEVNRQQQQRLEELKIEQQANISKAEVDALNFAEIVAERARKAAETDAASARLSQPRN